MFLTIGPSGVIIIFIIIIIISHSMYNELILNSMYCNCNQYLRIVVDRQIGLWQLVCSYTGDRKV